MQHWYSLITRIVNCTDFCLDKKTDLSFFRITKTWAGGRRVKYGALNMNMISTGSFLTEMDASNKQEAITEKFARVWEKKNSKAARAGGVSLMALSLAACGSDDDTAAVEEPTTPVEPTAPVIAGKALVYTNSTTADVLVGGDGDDTATAASGTYADADQLVDSSTADADVANIVVTAAANPNITNVETLNITAESTATAALDMSKVVGANTLNFSKGDITVGGSVVKASSVVELDNVDSANVSTINVTGTVTTVDVDAAATDKAGIVLNAETATGNVTVDGAATINANASTGTVAINAVSNTTAAETVKASVINAAKATTVTTHADLTGSIEINAAAATTVTVADAQGGVVINAAKGATSSDGIDVRGIDASGATITTGSYASTAAGTIDIGGTALTTDTATISAAGSVNLDIGVAVSAVDVLNLNANGAAVTYTVTATNGAMTSAVLGADVTAKGDEAIFAGKTITGEGTLDLSAGTADAVDLSKVDVAKIKIGFDNDNNPAAPDHQFTVKSGQTIELYANQSNFDIDFLSTEASGDLTLIAGDVNGALNSAVGTLTTGVLDLAAAATVAGTVTIEASDANLTATTSTTLGAKQALVVTGDEDVTLAAVTAASVDATASTGKISLTAGTGVKSVSTGSGADTVVASGAVKHVVSTGSGKDTLTITTTADAASFDAGEGDDTINANSTAAYVVVAGDGNDTITTNADIDAIIVGGEGTDTFDVNNNGAFDASNNANFALASIEKIDLVGLNNTMTVTAAQFAGFNTAEVTGDAAADILRVNAAATGSTIDASGLTVKTGGTVTIKYAGGAKADTITGGVASETFLYSQGGDSIEGGATGTDTFDYDGDTTLTITGSDASTGAVVNISASAVTDTTIFAGIGKYTANGIDVAAGTAVNVFDANKTTNSTEATNLSGIENVVTGDGADYIVGSAENNQLEGLGGNDYISGGDGDDTIIGAAGNDTVVLGNGADTLVFAGDQIDSGGVAANFVAGSIADVGASLGKDTITSYVVADDKIKLYESIFGADIDGNSDGALDAAHFASVADAGTAINVDMTGGGLVYNQATKELLFVNGDHSTAGAAAADEIEELTAGTDYFVIAVFTSVTGTMAATEFEVIA